MMKKIMILPLLIMLVCASFFSGCVEEEKDDGTTEVSVGTLVLKITDKPPELDIIYANVTISKVQVHKAGAGEEENDDEGDNGAVADEVDGNLSVDAGGNYTGTVGEIIEFTGTASGGVEPYNWSWNFGDGNTSELKDPSNIYNEEGTYDVNLTVTDFNNSTAWDITFAIIESEEEDGEGDAGWYTIVNESQIFDLIALQDVTDVLGEQTLSTGKYTQIRLTIEKAEITINDSGDHLVHDLKIPSGSIKLTKGFWIYEDQTTILTLDFDIHESVHKTGSDKYILKPTIKIIQE
jgi:PKD repeat protein